jgi:tRNA threonylcarbamoyladenosine biosynthesis protein TsaE
MMRLLQDEAATEAFGAELLQWLPEKCVVFLRGRLGAGKTTLVRGFLRAAGYRGTVKSPTFTLVEEYRFDGRTVLHFDLYRLADPEELEWIGIRDYLAEQAVCFIEWPEMGRGFLPEPDVAIELAAYDGGRRLGLEKNFDPVKKYPNGL